MEILESVAYQELICKRCATIGIPNPTILFEDTFFILKTDEREFNCCKDCFERLREEII